MATRTWSTAAAMALVMGAVTQGGMGCAPADAPAEVAGSAAGEPVGAAQQAITTCITIQRGTHGTVEDALISDISGKSDKNYGDSGSLTASIDATGVREGLVQWDVSEIPAGSVIASATASFTKLLNGGAPLSIHDVTAPWSEATVTYDSFNQAFDSSVAATLADVPAPSADVTALVQGWVDGSSANHGILIDRAADGLTVLASSEVADVTQRPKLDVCYDPPPDHCAPNPCQNGGTCQDNPTGYTCTCPTGFSGTDCEIAPVCPSGFAAAYPGDTYASIPVPATLFAFPAIRMTATFRNDLPNAFVFTPSSAHQAWVAPPGCNDHTCIFEPSMAFLQHPAANVPPGGTFDFDIIFDMTGVPLTGEAISFRPMDENLYGNLGSDRAGIVSVTFDCAPTCAVSPCQNGGTCTDGANGFTCACPPGYGGVACQLDIDDCAASPCAHGACTDGVNSYTCACDPGWSGTNCDVASGPCAAAPCQNGGTCSQPTPSTYACACPSGYSGTDCEILDTGCPCDADPVWAQLLATPGGSALDASPYGITDMAAYGFDSAGILANNSPNPGTAFVVSGDISAITGEPMCMAVDVASGYFNGFPVNPAQDATCRAAINTASAGTTPVPDMPLPIALLAPGLLGLAQIGRRLARRNRK